MPAQFIDGDVFEVPLDEEKKGYIQFLWKDSTQLGGHVVRVFKKKYTLQEQPDFEQIIQNNIDFHAHTVLQCGVQRGLWKKKGRVEEPKGISDLFFRNSDDYGD